MPWPNVQVKDLYPVCLEWWHIQAPSSEFASACAWVEAENLWDCRRLIQQWFELLERGETDYHKPDPLWQGKPWEKPVTQERVDRFISELDADFDKEETRWRNAGNKGRPAMPEFHRLSPSARLAFFQEFRAIYLPPDEAQREAQRRLNAGENLPPWNSPTAHEYTCHE